MVTLASPSPLDRILAEHVANITGFIQGTASYGQRFQATQYSDATNYANTFGNTDTTNGRAVKIQYGDPLSPTTLATFQKSGITLQSNDGTQSISITNSGISISGGFLVFDLTAYGGVGDGETDNTTAFHTAASAVSAAGGGILWVPAGIFEIQSRVTIGTGGVHNVHVRGTGISDNNVSGFSCIKVDFTSMPAIVIGGSATAYSGSNCSIEDVTIVHNNTPVGATYAGGTVGATICVDRVHGTLSTNYESVEFRRVKFVTSEDCIQVGTANDPIGAGTIVVDTCQGDSANDFLIVKGGNYLYVTDCRLQESVARDGGAFIRFDGAGTNQPDGGRIHGNFTEAYSYGILVANTAGSVASLLIQGNQFDGCGTAGVYLTGTQNKLKIDGNQITGFNAANNYGILIDEASGRDVLAVSISNNTISGCGSQGILVVTPTGATDYRDLLIGWNRILGCGIQTTNTFPGIDLQNGVAEARVLYNEVTGQSGGNVVSHGVRTGTGATAMAVVGNVALDAGTAAVSMGTTPNGTTIVCYDNHGPVASGTAFPGNHRDVGPWHSTDPGAGTAAFAMARPGTDGNLFAIAPYACHAVGISLSAVNNAGAATAIAAAGSRTATATIRKNNSAGTLATTFTPDGAAFGSVARQAMGVDTFAAGDRIGVQLATGASWVANDDVTVVVTIVNAP